MEIKARALPALRRAFTRQLSGQRRLRLTKRGSVTFAQGARDAVGLDVHAALTDLHRDALRLMRDREDGARHADLDLTRVDDKRAPRQGGDVKEHGALAERDHAALRGLRHIDVGLAFADELVPAREAKVRAAVLRALRVLRGAERAHRRHAERTEREGGGHREREREGLRAAGPRCGDDDGARDVLIERRARAGGRRLLRGCFKERVEGSLMSRLLCCLRSRLRRSRPRADRARGARAAHGGRV